jgi:hypothetical protein
LDAGQAAENKIPAVQSVIGHRERKGVGTSFRGEWAEAFGHLGDVPRGLAALDQALDWTERTEVAVTSESSW